MNESYFRNDDLKFSINKDFTLDVLIPPQIDNSSIFLFLQLIAMTKRFENAFDFLDQTMTQGVIVNIGLSLFLGLSMKLIWNLINTLQILTHIPLLNIVLPANFMLCLKSIIDVSNISIIPKQIQAYLLRPFLIEEPEANNDSFNQLDIFYNVNLFPLFLNFLRYG